MKRLRLIATLVILSVCFSLHAEIVSGTCGANGGDNLTWTFDTESGLLKIEGSGEMEDFKNDTPPWTLYNNTILQVNLLDGVTTIGRSAFKNCVGLTSVTIPSTVFSIGVGAFSDCSGLKSISIPNSITVIEGGAFQNCTGLTSIIIPSSVTLINYSAFKGCTGLTTITIPNSVTSINSSVFEGCTGLTSISIPNSITSIGTFAFSGCTGLSSIIIPNSVTSIGMLAFNNCSGLTSITISDNVTSIEEGTFCGCSSLISIVIPNSVTHIGNNAFDNCTNLTSITIPSSVTSIGDNIFSCCTNLKDIVMVNDMFVFMPKDYNGNYTISNNIKTILGSAFSGCTGLTSVTIPNSVTIIGDAAFSGCTGLTSVTIPNSLTSIGNNVYAGCDNIRTLFINTSKALKIACQELYIGDDVTTVYDYYNFDQLRKVVLGKKVSQIRAQAFSNANIQEFTITGEEPPYCYPNIFGTQDLSAATLYVPASKAEYYQTTEPWTEFGIVKTLEGDAPVIPTACEKPAIAFENGKLLFTCGTNGAKYHCSITSPDMKNNELNESGVVDLQACYDIYVYATADGFTQSETATAKLYWVKADGGISGINQIEMRGIVVSSDNGFVNVSGLHDGEQVTLYSTDGKLLGMQSAQGGACIFTTFEKVVIVKVGDSSFKVMVK